MSSRLLGSSFLHPRADASPWLPWARQGRSCDPAVLLEASSSPLELQRPGSWVTSVLSQAWFPGIPGVAGSSSGLFWDHHKLYPSPVNGTFHRTRLRRGDVTPNYRGSAGWGRVRPRVGPRVPRRVTPGQSPAGGHSAPLLRGPRPHGAQCASGNVSTLGKMSVCLFRTGPLDARLQGNDQMPLSFPGRLARP